MKHPHGECESCPLQSSRMCTTYFPEEHNWALEVEPTILFVGQAPGDIEVVTNSPFTGPAGKQHYSLMRSAGMNKPQYPHTNSVLCHPGKDKKGNDLRPPLQAILRCQERLKQDILWSKPGLIVALGEDAMFALTRQKGIQSKRGSTSRLIDFFEYDCLVMSLLHPSFVMRQRQWIPLAVENYKEAVMILESGKQMKDKPNLILDPDVDTLNAYLEDSTVVYGVDTETTGLNYLDDTVLGVSFAKDTKSAVAVFFKGDDDPRREAVVQFLESDEKKKCWQNGSYDTGILKGSMGISPQGFEFDTRLAQQMIASDLPSGLDFLRSHYTSIPPYKPSKQEYKRLMQIGKDRILELAALDAVTTKVVMEEQLKQLKPSQTKLIKELLIPLVEVLNEVQLRGILVDQERLLQFYLQIDPLVEAREKPFIEAGVNPRSPKQLAPWLGIESTDEKTLNYLIKRNHPKSEWMQKLLDYRDVQTIKSKYIVGIFKRLREGRIHTHYKIEGTGTGRLASENPNLQNVPDILRAIYIPDPGHVFLAGDWKQVELWVGAIVAEEWQMLDDLKAGIDVHFEAAKLCFPQNKIIHNDRKKDFTHRQELVAKTVVFGTFYGRGKESISREFGVSQHEAEGWQNALLGRWPNLLNYKKKAEQAFERDGFITTPFGRIRYLNSLTQGLNAPIQSTAADVMLKTLVMLRNDAGIYCPITVYDDITSMPEESSWKKTFDVQKEIMTRPFPELHGESFRVDFKMGHNWYEMTSVPE